jgi:hypothetical protein
VIAIDGLNTHSFQWDSLYALAVPEGKRQAIAESVAPGAARDIYAGLTKEERDVLNELLNAGFARLALEDMKFAVSGGPGAGAIQSLDPAYEDDFWSRPGYEGASPPAYLAAAKVDGFATIASVTRNDQGAIAAVTFDPATVECNHRIGNLAAEDTPAASRHDNILFVVHLPQKGHGCCMGRGWQAGSPQFFART